ncbi:MAG: methylated-DNA--[protein]-cysteine S-methyltransferase [Dysgonamonadaceae bacterium]|jgi:AraC family transcriptional regulator of adaptative response/methylated-DNA-[protein]-cysteine methyltransferase|nr:methylated-DNA--[protein]-cysteine S-methyltransferase [Dysgonamonadaceae bacterium]
MPEYISIFRMTEEDYRKLSINYTFRDSMFGMITVASTGRGVCYLAFQTEGEIPLNDLKRRFPYAILNEKTDDHQQSVISAINRRRKPEIILHLKGTDFQLDVWKCLLEIPFGKLSTYREIARQCGHENACRATGTAIGANPVSLIIPCHRVVQTSGGLGGYRWGVEKKKLIIEWEKSLDSANRATRHCLTL